MLSAEAILIADQEMLTPQIPIIMYGVRGNAYFEIEVRGPAHDLHSGTFGGGVDNPFNVLVRLLAALMDEKTHRVRVPGFYDRVRPLSPEERQLISRAPIDDSAGLLFTGAPELRGEEGFTLAERISVRPTLDIHGISGGFTGQGGKTVIPARAAAKFSTRLVPDQSPEEIVDLVEKYLRRLSPPTVKLNVRVLGTARPVLIDYHAPAVRLAVKAYELGVGASPVYLRGGGSLPIVREMIDVLSNTQELRNQAQVISTERQIPIVMIGFGLPDDNSHAPNEKLHLPNFYNGIKTVIHYLDLFQNISSVPSNMIQ